MKTQKIILKSLALIAFTSIIFSCNQDKADPAVVLDEVMVPQGYRQIDNPSSDVLGRLQELRLENPDNNYYYLERENKNVTSSRAWIFPQKELKIEYVDNDKSSKPNENPQVLGVIVKKIKGDYREEEFIIIDSQPSPKTGMKEFYTYVADNLKYPEQARKMGIEGKVFVEFIVDNDGKLINVKAIKGIGAGCDEEAVRVLKEAPKWIPGKVVNMPVKVRMILPVTFRLG